MTRDLLGRQAAPLIRAALDAGLSDLAGRVASAPEGAAPTLPAPQRPAPDAPPEQAAQPSTPSDLRPRIPDLPLAPTRTKGKVPSLIEIARDTLPTLRQQIRDLFDRAVNHNGNGRIVLGRVTKEGADEINRQFRSMPPIGKPVDVTDFEHTVDANELRHTWNKHGGPNEKTRGNIPLSPEDFDRILEILAEPDKMTVTPSSDKTVASSVVYRKKMDNVIFVIEEVRTGRQQLAFKTMYKNPD